LSCFVKYVRRCVKQNIELYKTDVEDVTNQITKDVIPNSKQNQLIDNYYNRRIKVPPTL